MVGNMETQTNANYKDYSLWEIPQSPFDAPRYEKIIYDIQFILQLQQDEEVKRCFVELSELRQKITDEKTALFYMKNKIVKTNEQFLTYKEQLTGDYLDKIIRDLNNVNHQFESKFMSYVEIQSEIEKVLEYLENLLLDEREKDFEDLGEEASYSALAYDIKTYASNETLDESFNFLIDGLSLESDGQFPEIKCVVKSEFDSDGVE